MIKKKAETGLFFAPPPAPVLEVPIQKGWFSSCAFYIVRIVKPRHHPGYGEIRFFFLSLFRWETGGFRHSEVHRSGVFLLRFYLVRVDASRYQDKQDSDH